MLLIIGVRSFAISLYLFSPCGPHSRSYMHYAFSLPSACVLRAQFVYTVPLINESINVYVMAHRFANRTRAAHARPAILINDRVPAQIQCKDPKAWY